MDLKRIGASMFKRGPALGPAPEPASRSPILNRAQRRRQEKLSRRSCRNGRGKLRGEI
jgi:hypothetical protein